MVSVSSVSFEFVYQKCVVQSKRNPETFASEWNRIIFCTPYSSTLGLTSPFRWDNLKLTAPDRLADPNSRSAAISFLQRTHILIYHLIFVALLEEKGVNKIHLQVVKSWNWSVTIILTLTPYGKSSISSKKKENKLVLKTSKSQSCLCCDVSHQLSSQYLHL